MGVDVGKNYKTWNSQKTQKRKVLEKLVSLQSPNIFLANFMLFSCSLLLKFLPKL